MKTKRIIPLAVVMATAAFAAGCGEDEEKDTAATGSAAAETTTHSMDGGNASSEGRATNTGAATLRAGLTSLLQEHVYLAGAAVDAGVSEGLDSGAFKAAAGTLDANSVDLSKAIGSVYGAEAEEAFLKQWREHIGFFVDYTKGLATKDQALADKAQKNLDGYRESFATFLNGANPNIEVEATADSLQEHVKTLSSAIESVVGGKSNAFAQLREAAQHMPMTAAYLAGAIAEQKPEEFDGAVDSPASELRTGLTNLLQEHVYLAGFAVKTGLGAGLDSKAFEAAAGTLDENSVALSKAIGSVYGEEAETAFLKQWREHIGFFVEYTKGVATKDNAAKRKALDSLDGYRQSFAKFLEGANPEIEAGPTAESLQEHVKTLTSAIRGVASGSPEAYDRLRAAAQHMPSTADYLAGAIAKQQKLS